MSFYTDDPVRDEMRYQSSLIKRKALTCEVCDLDIQEGHYHIPGYGDICQRCSYKWLQQFYKE